MEGDSGWRMADSRTGADHGNMATRRAGWLLPNLESRVRREADRGSRMADSRTGADHGHMTARRAACILSNLESRSDYPRSAIHFAPSGSAIRYPLRS
jgi:hypothetical protein